MLTDYVCSLFEGHVWSSGGAPIDRFVTDFGKTKGGTSNGVLFSAI